MTSPRKSCDAAHKAWFDKFIAFHKLCESHDLDMLANGFKLRGLVEVRFAANLVPSRGEVNFTFHVHNVTLRYVHASILFTYLQVVDNQRLRKALFPRICGFSGNPATIGKPL